MSAQEPELEALMIAALRADLPAQRERERIRARLLAAGVAVSAGTTVGAVASTAQAAALASGGALEGALAGGKVAGLSLAAKIGWSAAVVATASTLSLAPQWSEHEPERPQPAVAAQAPRSAPAAARTRTASAPAALPAMPPALPASVDPIAAHELPHAPPIRAISSQAVPPTARTARAVRSVPIATPVVVAEATFKTSGEPVADLERPLPADAQAAAPAALPPGARVPPSRAPGVLRTEPVPVPVPVPTASSLRAETELIARALSALHAGEHGVARHWLAAHARRFPDGELRRERERAQRYLESSHPAVPEASNAGGHDHE